MANKKKKQEQAVKQAVEDAGKKVSVKEYNQILKIAGNATSAAIAIANSGAVVKPATQQAINQSIVPTYDTSKFGGKGLGMNDVNYLTSLGVDNAGIKDAAKAAPWVTGNVYNNYKVGVTKEMLDIQDWVDSLNAQNEELINTINAQTVNNQADNTDWINQINTLTSAISTAQQQQEQLQGPQGAYAVVTAQNAPAAGAKTTSAIAPRRKPNRNPLSISPAMSSSAGAGLNIAA